MNLLLSLLFMLMSLLLFPWYTHAILFVSSLLLLVPVSPCCTSANLHTSLSPKTYAWRLRRKFNELKDIQTQINAEKGNGKSK